MAIRKYKVIGSFYYHGPNGKDPQGVIIAPGEEVPKLDSEQMEKLLMQQRIAEISDKDGEIIKYKKLEDLTDEEIRNFVSKNYNFVSIQLRTRYFSNETLSRIYSQAEEMKVHKSVLQLIEDKIEGKIV